LNGKNWIAFRKTVDQYRSFINKTAAAMPGLGSLIQKLVDSRDGPAYSVDTPVVYNCALDDFTADSEIKLILVGDNPGRREQAAENRRYLVGPSGKIANNFFQGKPALGIDFRKNVRILNKTPTHPPRTAELKTLCALGGKEAEELVLSSQREMAQLLFKFWKALPAPPVWIIGYSEMKKGGLFEAYTGTLREICRDNPAFWENIRFYRHFSMNQFTIDLKNRSLSGESLEKSLERIGTGYRELILGLK
jgi:hypothetical protein